MLFRSDLMRNRNSVYLAIAKLCPNLRKLSILTLTDNDELETLKVILNNCQYLESIGIDGGDESFDVKRILDILARYSSKNLHELTFFCFSDALSLCLEEFFINWKDRTSQKSLSFYAIYYDNMYYINVDMEVIEKYKKLGVIKRFEETHY